MMVTIDHITKCQIDSADAITELQTLRYLRSGLHHLYEQVTMKETPLRGHDEKTGSWRAVYVTNPTLGADDILQCFFHWYAVSLINYARLVGFLSGISSKEFTRHDLEDRGRFKKIRKYCDSYVNDVGELSAIRIWRNKIPAHLAITAPRADDNPALLNFAVVYPVGYRNGRFRVGVFSLRLTDSAGNPHTGKFPPWSLTETHEALQGRYWKTALP